MKKSNKNNTMLLVGMLAISFSSKAMHSDGVVVEEPRLADGDGQPGRVNKEPRNLNFFQMSLRTVKEKLGFKPSSKPAPASSSKGVDQGQPRTTTTTVADSSAVLDKTLTEQDKVAIEKAGKGGFVSFFRPKPKPETDAGRAIVAKKLALMKGLSPAEKQLFNEVLAQRPQGNETLAQYSDRMDTIVKAEKVVMQAITDIFTERANTDLYQGFDDAFGRPPVNKAKMSNAELKVVILDLGGQIDRSSVERAIKKMTNSPTVTAEMSKVLEVLFKGQKTSRDGETENVSNTFKSIVDQASSDGVVAYRKKVKNPKKDLNLVLQDRAPIKGEGKSFFSFLRRKPKAVVQDQGAREDKLVVNSESLAEGARQDVTFLARRGFKNKGEVAVKVRKINELLTRKIEDAHFSKAQADLFRDQFNVSLDTNESLDNPVSVAEYGKRMDVFISAEQAVSADLEAAYRAAFKEMGRLKFNPDSKAYIKLHDQITTGEFPAIEATSQAVFTTPAEKEAYDSLVALLKKSTAEHVRNKELRAAAPYNKTIKAPLSTEQEKVVAGFLQDALGKATVTKPEEEEPVFRRTVVPAEKVIRGLTEGETGTDDEVDSEA